MTKPRPTDSEPPRTEERASEAERPRRLSSAPPIVFVGGTGRSGTHVLARLLGKHHRLALIPVEVRFHVEERGFPGLLDGTVSKHDFVERLRGFWWKGFQTTRMRGMFRFVPNDQFESAVDAFEARFDDDPEGACRQLFYDLLWFKTSEVDPSGRGPPGLVEQSTDTIAAAPTLVRLFPEAKFIHVVRDGRDASASRVAQTRGLIPPRTRREGLEWWEERIRRIDAGEAAIAPDRLLTVSLDELVLLEAPKPALRPLCRFLDLYVHTRMRAFFKERMSEERANTERWRRGLSDRRAAELERAYEDVVARLEADRVRCAPLLRQTLERSREGGEQLKPIPFVAGDGTPLGPGARPESSTRAQGES
jgi:sulfotransferase family protein